MVLLAVIHTDLTPGFTALINDKLLHRHRITLEVGRAKNPNKNPVAEKAVQELECELLRQDPLGGAVLPPTLSIATAAVKSRVRSRGLSSREMWTQRDQFTNAQIPLGDSNLIATQHELRLTNHPYSERSKAPLPQKRLTPMIEVGDLVYLHSDRNKSRARDRYPVVSIDAPFCNIRKFVGSQLRSSSYRVKLSECFKVPSEIDDTSPFSTPHDNDDPADNSDPDPEPLPLPPPSDIPDAISVLTFQGIPHHTASQPAEPSSSDHVAAPTPTNDFGVQAPYRDSDPSETLSDSERSTPSSGDGPRRSSHPRRPPARFEDFATDF